MFGRIAAVFESAVSLALVAPAVITPTFAAPTATKLAPNDIQSTFFTGQPFTAATNSNVKFMMTFTPDGKMTRAPAGGGERRRHLEIVERRFLHHLEERRRQLLYRHQRRQQ